MALGHACPGQEARLRAELSRREGAGCRRITRDTLAPSRLMGAHLGSTAAALCLLRSNHVPLQSLTGRRFKPEIHPETLPLEYASEVSSVRGPQGGCSESEDSGHGRANRTISQVPSDPISKAPSPFQFQVMSKLTFT